MTEPRKPRKYDAEAWTGNAADQAGPHRADGRRPMVATFEALFEKRPRVMAVILLGFVVLLSTGLPAIWKKSAFDAIAVAIVGLVFACISVALWRR